MKLKTFESISREIDIEKLSKHYTGEKINICEDIIQNIKDILIELKDIKVEVFTYVDYTPFTWICKNQYPEIFLDIQVKDSDMMDEQIKSEVEDVYERILKYLNSNDDDAQIEEFRTDKSSVRFDNSSYISFGLTIKIK